MKFLFKYCSDVCLAYQNVRSEVKLCRSASLKRETRADRFPARRTHLNSRIHVILPNVRRVSAASKILDLESLPCQFVGKPCLPQTSPAMTPTYPLALCSSVGNISSITVRQRNDIIFRRLRAKNLQNIQKM